MLSRFKSIIKPLLALFFAIPAHCYALTGNDLHEFLNDSDESGRLVTTAYIRGILDSESFFFEYEILNAQLSKRANYSRIFFCIPNGASVGQATDIVKIYLAANPQSRHDSALQIVRRALKERWPCK